MPTSSPSPSLTAAGRAVRPLAPVASIQGTLALDLTDRDPPLARPSSPGPRGGDVVALDELTRRRLDQWAHRLAQAVVEIVAGDRPVSQLLRWTSAEVYADLARRAVLVARAGGRTPGVGGPGSPAVRAQVAGVRTSVVSAEAVEVSVHVRHGVRSRAIAARLEVRGGRWQCVALEFA